jgi:hypothetical protein
MIDQRSWRDFEDIMVKIILTATIAAEAPMNIFVAVTPSSFS